MIDSTHRFSDRVDNYVKYRPSYPAAVLDILSQEAGLTSASRVADIGSGTGISAELFLKAGCTVLGIEPNREMRRAAEKMLQDYPAFHSITGTAEATTLPAESVDYVVAAQAFHWFDLPAAKHEIFRILKPGGWLVLMWNSRRMSSTPFLQAYESLLQKYGTDYAAVGHRIVNRPALEAFANGNLELRKLYNEQIFDFQGLKGRLLSSSYVPKEGHASFQPMMDKLTQLFKQHNDNGFIRIEYDTELYWSRYCDDS